MPVIPLFETLEDLQVKKQPASAHMRRDWAHPCHIYLQRDWAGPRHICTMSRCGGRAIQMWQGGAPSRHGTGLTRRSLDFAQGAPHSIEQLLSIEQYREIIMRAGPAQQAEQTALVAH